MQQANVLNQENLPKLPPRKRDCHKGQLGHVVVLAGAEGMGGAGLLAAQAALRLGAGLVSLLTHSRHIAASLARQPEIMVHDMAGNHSTQSVLKQATVVLAGPGLGQAPEQLALLRQVALLDVPQVWDADALNMLSMQAENIPQVGLRIITPHPGEAARLLGCTIADIQDNRAVSAQMLSRRYGSVVVLKGYPSLIASSDGCVFACNHGHPVMAGPGFGDVLGGVSAAFIAQGMELFDAACLAVWLHARAGEQLATHGRGVVAGDLLQPMRSLLEKWSPVI